jgi:cytochrome P450
MGAYADVLRKEDERVHELYSVERETLDSGSILIEDPFPELAKLREKAAVQKGALPELMGLAAPGRSFAHYIPGYPTYTAFSFSAVSRGLIENETFSSHVYDRTGATAMFGDAMIRRVGASHRCMRTPIQPLFTPEAAETWWSEKIIDETVETLISTIERKKGGADLFIELCARMPVHVVSAGFGLAPEDIIPFRIALTTPHHASMEERIRNKQTVTRMLQEVITARRQKPENDIISKLVEAQMELEDGTSRPFTDQEIIDNCTLIVLAGGGTTWRQLGITFYALLNHPEQFEALKADRSLAGKVILEAARWHPTDLVFPREATKDATLEGVDIPKGTMLHLCLGSANRDPSRWEDPDRFDISRPIQRSVAFAAGPHSCLGQHVSRQEMVAALNAVIDRLPNVRWDPSKPRAKLIGGLFARGPDALPVVFG